MAENNQQNRILLHTLKHSPQDGDVYITWQGETFCAKLTDITVHRGVNVLDTIELTAVISN